MARPTVYARSASPVVSTQRFKLSTWIAIGLVAHVPLALFLQANRSVSNLLPLAVTTIGLWMVYRRSPLVQFAYLAAYIAGAEVLWRLTRANIFWEYGKYLTVFILTLALIRHRAFKMSMLPLFYFVLLLPGILPPLLQMSLPEARDAISFNLSGHLALAFSAWFFERVKYTRGQLEKLLWMLIMPIVGVATISYNAVQNVSDWSVNSNNAASGNYSANQVSGILGLGLLAVWILLLYTKPKRLVAFAALVLGIWFLGQALLTLSRGGVLTAVVPGVLITILALFIPGRRKQILFLLLGVLVFAVALGPALDAITNGSLTERYTETDKRALTGRDDLIGAELQAFVDHPLMGVGVGQGEAYRAEAFGHSVATHTEYTRMLAEHGLFGLTSIILLFAMFLINFKRNWRNPVGRSVVLAAALWSLISLLTTAMRTVAPSFIFGLQFALFNLSDTPSAPTNFKNTYLRNR